jgi:hypothetical protein
MSGPRNNPEICAEQRRQRECRARQSRLRERQALVDVKRSASEQRVRPHRKMHEKQRPDQDDHDEQPDKSRNRCQSAPVSAPALELQKRYWAGDNSVFSKITPKRRALRWHRYRRPRRHVGAPHPGHECRAGWSRCSDGRAIAERTGCPHRPRVARSRQCGGAYAA